jgi:type IV secretion system protein VirB1
MDISTFAALVVACAPRVDVGTASALVAVESGFNPYAIGVVGGALLRQPRDRAEAVATVKALLAGGWNLSLGLAQINQRNFERLGLTVEAAFEPCSNLGAMQTVLGECFDRAVPRSPLPQHALRQGLSCYYSGDFVTGFHHGYVRKVVVASAGRGKPPALSRKESS